MGKSSPSAPAPPDYAGAAVAQGAANEATARLQGRMNNPNVIGPLGSQTVTFGTPTFNQAGYDQAMRTYSGQPQRGAAPDLSQFTTTDEGDENRAGRTSIDQAGYSQAMANWANSGVAGPAPTREQFTTNANADQPTVTQTLTPAAQSTLDAQQRVQRALAGLGEQGIGTAQNVLGNAFNPNLAGLQTSVGNAGQIPQTPNLSSYGQASGLSSLPKQSPKFYTNPSDFEGLNFASSDTAFGGANFKQMPMFTYAPGTSREQKLRNEAPYMTRDNYEQKLNYLREREAPTQTQQPMQAPELSAYGMAGSNVNAQPVNAGPQSGQYGMAGAGPQAGQYGFAGGGPGGGQYGLAGANVQAGAINQGPQARDFGSAQGNVAAPQLQNQIDTSGVGNVNYGPQTGQYGLASGALNTSNVAAMPVTAGMTGQQAIMNRLAPQLELSDAQTRQRLINQGLVPGGEAYENAMISQNQQKNDLLSQAALQGIGLDTAANAQGFGQALQAGQYGNQAVAQNFNQAQAAQAAQNAAQNQAFGQRVQSGQFGNQAQLASFGAGMQNAGLFNSALNQNLNTALSTQQAQNAAQQQGYAQQMGAQGLQNQAIGQNFGQGVTAQQLQNAGIGQNFAQGQAANAAGNQAVGQNFGQGLAAQQAQNAASQQLYNQYMGVQGLQNQAVNQNQQAALAQYQAQLAGQQQGFGQNVTQRQLGNQAISQNQQAALQQQQAALAAQNQQYNQLLQGAQFGNIAQQQSLAQQLALRNQPLNEIAGLMSGSQIQMPQFQGYQGSNVAPAPIFAGAQAAGQGAMDRYGIQSANVNAQNAGLYGLAGTAATGAMMFSDPRLKSNVIRIGTHPFGVGVYEYDIFGKRQRGVMADEVEAVMPEAVALHPSGYKMVNYGMIN